MRTFGCGRKRKNNILRPGSIRAAKDFFQGAAMPGPPPPTWAGGAGFAVRKAIDWLIGIIP